MNSSYWSQVGLFGVIGLVPWTLLDYQVEALAVAGVIALILPIVLAALRAFGEKYFTPNKPRLSILELKLWANVSHKPSPMQLKAMAKKLK